VIVPARYRATTRCTREQQGVATDEALEYDPGAGSTGDGITTAGMEREELPVA
jgi:hypothetical protein